MSDYLKGVILMAGFIGQALSALLKENEAVVAHAKTLGGVAACRVHRRECVRNMMTGEKSYRWQIEFSSEEDANTFDAAVRGIVHEVTEW